ncbi:hypothetical protein B0H63DRAFT_465591 [Podospora didyma]|uniref:Uncharacterized protein n=1 Tax=Podospora didyma TaxID=330526 RepID=A0AAE0U4F4_9PEZI|nr:hypothetical protein B0H63DRAFT_465591 [Podospora didyma]
MDHSRAAMGATATTATSSSASSTFRPLLRRPSVIALTVAVAGAGLGLGFKHVATTMRNNELAQKQNSSNFYVSVDRSGGGI